jgi:hypothetical protein
VTVEQVTVEEVPRPGDRVPAVLVGASRTGEPLRSLVVDREYWFRGNPLIVCMVSGDRPPPATWVKPFARGNMSCMGNYDAMLDHHGIEPGAYGLSGVGSC